MRLTPATRWLLPVVCALAWLAAVRAADRSPAAMADAANAFVASLTPAQRPLAVFAFASSEREHWGFVPTEMFARNGLTLGAMTEAQRGLAKNLLRSGPEPAGLPHGHGDHGP